MAWRGGADRHRRRDPGHVVVADEGLRQERRQRTRRGAGAPSRARTSCARRCELQIAFQSSYWVMESRPDSADVAGVVAVDHLADEPRVGVPLANARQHRGPERRGHGVGRVEPPAVDAAVEPVHHHVADVPRTTSGLRGRA